MRCGSQLRLLTAVVLPLFCTTARVRARTDELGRPVVKNYSPRAYGANQQVWSIAQDTAGMLYFGVDPHVVTYDGATWRKVTMPNSTDPVGALAVGLDGRVYVGGMNHFGWLRPLGNGRHEYVSLIDQLPEKEREFRRVNQIVVVGDTIYAVAVRRTLVWRGGTFSLLPGSSTMQMFVVHDTPYVTADKQPLRRVEGAQLVVASDDPVFRNNSIALICPAPENHRAAIVVTRSRKLFTLLDGRLTPRPTEVDAFLHDRNVMNGWLLPDGELALATKEAGLVIITTEGRFRYALDDTNGLQNPRVFSLARARDGGLWLGLNSGISHVDGPAAGTLFDTVNGLPNSPINDIARFDGTLYVSTTKDVFRLEPAQPPRQGAHFTRALKGEFFALYSDREQLLAAGNRAIYRKTAQGFEQVLSLPREAIYAIHRSKKDPTLYWCGGKLGLRAIRQTPEGWRDEGTVPGVEDVVRSVVEEPDGRIWASTYGKGVFRVTPSDSRGGKTVSTGARVEFFPGKDDQRRMVRVAQWGADTIFTSTREKTLFRFDESNRGFVPFGEVGRLPDDVNISSNILCASDPNWLWLTRTFTSQDEKRIYRLKRGGKVEALPQSIPETLGTVLRMYEEKGVLWVGGGDGLMRIDLGQAFRRSPSYAATVWTRAPAIHDGDRISYGRESIDFEFLAPRYTPAYPLKYQSRLMGERGIWSVPSTDTKRTYTHLDAGTYRFEVRAKDVDGHLSERAALAFTILPPWWRTWWAYGGYGLAFGAALLGFARLRTRSLRRKNEKLESVVAARTEDLRRQNGELARLHKLELDEKITARLAAEKAQLDVLRYQLNPHFLFNSLTSIRAQIPPGQGSARETVDRLADFCRLTLHGPKAEERTTIGEEIAMLRAYLDIEQTRLGELLSVAFEVDHALDDVPIPRLLLLPLVENALKYGQATSVDTLGLKISAQRGGDGLVFEIANTGEWVERGSRPGIPSTGIGHENLRERLRRHYPDTHAFSHVVAEGWVRVRVELFALAPMPA